MPPNDLDKFSRTISYEGKDIVIQRPGIAIVLYSVADITTVMRAAADLLTSYFGFVPTNALQSVYKPGPDEYTPGQWAPFDAVERGRLLDELQSAAFPPE